MTLSLHTLHAPPRSRRRRRGRGLGSGLGTYAGRGVKGQKARSGGRRGLHRRAIRQLIGHLPKVRGFLHPTPHRFSLTLDVLSQTFGEGEVVTIDKMRSRGLVHRRVQRVKVLRGRERPKPLHITAHAFSAGALAQVKESGGTANVAAEAAVKRPYKRTKEAEA